jgi:hypothetical protein
MAFTTIEFTTLENFWSSYFDENLMDSDYKRISKSPIWNDAILESDPEWSKQNIGYRYEIAFLGTKPVGCMSIWNEGSERFLHRNLSFLCEFKRII